MIDVKGFEAKWILHHRCILNPYQLETDLATAIYNLLLKNLGNSALSYRKIVGFNVIEPTFNITIDDTHELKMNKAYYQIYNNPNGFNDGHGNNKAYYMFGVPWLGNTESLKNRVDLFINGDVGYINNELVDYRDNKFAKDVLAYKQGTGNAMYTEQFINYSYSGETITTDDGEVLVDGAIAKDKTIIIYRQVNL